MPSGGLLGSNTGLQILVQRFDSASGLHLIFRRNPRLPRPTGRRKEAIPMLQKVASETRGFPSIPIRSRLFRATSMQHE